MSENAHRRKLYLRPDLAVIRMEIGVQLRAGDEEIHTIETELPEVVETMLQSMTGGADRASLEKAVGEENRVLIDNMIQQLAAAGLLLEQPIESGDTIGRYLAHFVHDGLRRPQSQSSNGSRHSPSAVTKTQTPVFPANGTGTVPAILNLKTGSQRPIGPVAVTGCIESERLLVRAISEHGIEVITIDGESPLDATDGPRVGALVCIWEQPNLKHVLRVNDAVCRWRMPCLFVDLSHGQHATLGPFYVSGEGACYQCYRNRWRENTATPAEFEAAESAVMHDGQILPAYGILPAFRYQVVGMACAELFALLARHRPLQTLNRTATIDLEGMKLWTEPCWQIPWCPICGTEG